MHVSRRLWVILLFLSLELSLTFLNTINDEAQAQASVSGIVVDEKGMPVQGANVTLLDLRWRRIRRMVSTDSNGRFYITVSKEGAYLIYVTCDRKDTPGVDYLPQRWRVWISMGSNSTHRFVMKKAASVYLEGEVRSIKSKSPASACYFEVEEIEKKLTGNYWTGPVRDYGSKTDIVNALGYDERLVVIPANTKVAIKVTAEFGSIYKGKGWKESFTVTGKTGYIKLSPGEILYLDMRESSLLSNIEEVQDLLKSSLYLLEECRDAGFLVEAERRDLQNSHRLLDESLSLLKKKDYDQSFAKLRSSYILATKVKDDLEGLIITSSQSFFPILFILLFISFSSSYLIAERRNILEISMGKWIFSLPINMLIGIIFYIGLVILFYLLFPGCRLVHEVVFITAAALSLIVGQSTLLLAPRLFPEKESENRSIRIQSALIAAFSMACRNLRRRKIRTIMSLINIMILVFGFITLTSISPGYGVVAQTIRPSIPVDALLIKDEPIGGNIGEFIPIPESFIDWLKSQPNITLIAPKAENTPVSSLQPLGHLYSTSGESMTVLGIIGIIPSVEANITGLNSIIVEGEYLKDNETQGVLISSDLKELLKVNVGDSLYGFNQEFVIRGFFDTKMLENWRDIDGNPIRPYMYDPIAGSFPSSGKNVIIVTYEKALKLPKVSISRVTIQLRNKENYEEMARTIILTYDYDVYISHPGSLVRQTLGSYVEEKGLGLIPFLMGLVILNIGASMLGSVRERREEIASLSSIGLNPTHIASLFVAEAIVLAFIGGGFGYLLGISSYRLASNPIFGALEVREKTSAEWGLIALFFSLATAILGSLIPALQSSTLVTPSLLRRWRIRESERPEGADNIWKIDLPIKILQREIEPFTAFILDRLEESGGVTRESIKLEKISEEARKISFIYNPPELGYRSHNELTVRKSETSNYNLTLLCTPEGPPSHAREIVHRTATYVRKLILEWNAKTFEVATPYDPSLSQLYNLVNIYNPTTLYILSTRPDVDEKLEEFRNALILRGIRIPKIIVSTVDLSNLEETIKKAEEIVSKADVICVSGKPAALCMALAINAAKQKKMICYVLDDRPEKERLKNPYEELEVINVL